MGINLSAFDGDIAIAIQARMSSERFPGKVLAKLQGRTIIEHLIRRFAKLNLPCFVLTSEHFSDDPLVEFLQDTGQRFFRGYLDDVLGRYVSFAEIFSFNNLVRISADSPLLHPDIVSGAIDLKLESRGAVVTNIYPRTFPKGQSVEIIKTSILEKNIKFMNKSEKEHVTKFFYTDKIKIKIKNFKRFKNFQFKNYCIDNKRDIKQIKKIMQND